MSCGLETKITVIIPVGPYEANKRWLDECLDSLKIQTHLPDEVLIISDMAGLPAGMDHRNSYPIRTYVAPWRLGIAHAFNFGVALAMNECVFMLGSDDWLESKCLESCAHIYEQEGQRKDTYYYCGVRYSDDREDQLLPCNAAMVTKELWEKTGGFPIEASTGAPDAAFCSIFWGRPDLCRFVAAHNRPLYNYRVHSETDTAKRNAWQGVILATRDLVTKQWKPL